MRRYLLYVSTIVLAVITVAYLAIGLGERRPLYPRIFPFENARRAQDFLDSLQEAHIPVTEINLSALYSENGQFQILHPLLWMNDLHQKTQIAACSKMESAVLKSARPTFACEDKPSILNEANAAQATKQHLYERILNNESRPTDEFIRTPPFIAPDGNSYAYLLTTNGVAPFHSSEWIRSHLSFFKTTELKEILLSHRIENRAFRTLSQLSELEVNALVEGLPLVITPHTLLLKNQDRLGFSPLSYRVYSIQDVKSRLDEKADDFNSDQTYDLIPFTTSTFCLERIGNGCWTYGANTAMSYLNRYAAAVLVLITSGILIFTTMYLKRAHERNRDRERYRIALQVLSHEFRTPVSVMILLLDQLTRAVSRVDEAKQDIITRFSGEVYRLQRVIEMSKTYLQSSSRATRFNWVKIPSLNDWLMEFCEESNLHLKYEVL
ncbi:MAG: hypothetical protein NDI61_03045, partial [Bdellovibrionaceae bacterium]|nr:hypothetical protein [Pseudobdellovibrionaceae bacterium]